MKQTNKDDLKILRIITIVVSILKIGLHKSYSVKGALPISVTVLVCLKLSYMYRTRSMLNKK